MIRVPLCRRSLIVVAASIVLASLAVATSAPASGGPGDRRGNCSGPSEWRLVVQHHHSGLRVRFEVEGGKAGQKWHVFLSDNGHGIFAGSRTSGSDGHFEVKKQTADQAGKDKVRASANNLATGETCGGHATL